MKLIRIFTLSVVVFYLTQEDETDALIARMIEGGINLGIDIGLKIIKIPIMKGGKLIWYSIKVPAKFFWSLAKIPFHVIRRLAWKLTKKPYEKITPQYLQDSLKQLIKDYRMKKEMRRKRKSRFHHIKQSIKNKISQLENRRAMRRNKHKNNSNHGNK